MKARIIGRHFIGILPGFPLPSLAMEFSILQSLANSGVAGVLLIFQLAGLFLAGRVILSNRSTHGTIAWGLSLVMLPLIAVPLYLLFGRNRLESYIEARRRIDREFMRTHPIHPEHPEGSLKETEDRSEQWKILVDLAKVPLTSGNEVELSFTGRETFASIAEGMQRAREYILFQFFIFRTDEEGRRFTEIMKTKAKEGVRVYFLVDAIGSRHLPRMFFRELREAGIEAGRFLPGRTLRGRLRLNFRNHRKVVVVDGREAWTGGHNIGVEYVGGDKRMGAWRDTHLRVKGPAVNAIQLAFLEDWFWVMRSKLELNWDVAPANAGLVKALCLATGPTDPEDTCTLAFVHLINQAKKRLWIHSPYFVPAEEVIIALQLATLRGVDVRILLPSQKDHRMVWLSSFYFSSLPQLNRVRFYRYHPGFFHSKMMLVDDEILATGTVNFDNRSFRINFEITLVMQDPEIIRTSEEQMRRDFAQSREDPVDPLAIRSLPFRLAARSVRLLSPLL
ncbi:MAG: cardiolipin synthase [Oceanipulchritudo sp.]